MKRETTVQQRAGALAAGMLCVLAACGGDDTGSGPVEETYPADCAGLDAEATTKCGEQRYWHAHNHAFDEREATHALLTDLLPRAGEGEGRLTFLRGTLAMELVLEHGLVSYLESIQPDLSRAVELDPENPKYPPWVDSMDLTMSFLANDMNTFDAAKRASVEHVELYPVGNILSITGTMSGFPMSTGLPQKAVELLERWSCGGVDWCSDNTDRAPFSQPGIAYHFADAYARVGNKEKARSYLEQALAAPRADAWPFRALAEDALKDIDAYVDPFVALGEEGSAMYVVYANSKQGCRLCHGAADATE